METDACSRPSAGRRAHGGRDHAMTADRLDPHAIWFRAWMNPRRLGDAGDAVKGRWRSGAADVGSLLNPLSPPVAA